MDSKMPNCGFIWSLMVCCHLIPPTWIYGAEGPRPLGVVWQGLAGVLLTLRPPPLQPWQWGGGGARSHVFEEGGRLGEGTRSEIQEMPSCSTLADSPWARPTHRPATDSKYGKGSCQDDLHENWITPQSWKWSLLKGFLIENTNSMANESA